MKIHKEKDVQNLQNTANNYMDDDTEKGCRLYHQ